MREVAQADPAETELAEHGARAAAAVAARVVPHLELRPAGVLDDERLLRHSLAVPSLRGERQAEPAQKRVRLLVRRRCGGDRDVEASDRRDAVVVDLREDDLLANAEREIAAAVERAGVEPPEVPDARERDRAGPVEELPHARAAQRHARADRHALAQLEARDRLGG